MPSAETSIYIDELPIIITINKRTAKVTTTASVNRVYTAISTWKINKFHSDNQLMEATAHGKPSGRLRWVWLSLHALTFLSATPTGTKTLTDLPSLGPWWLCYETKLNTLKIT